MGKFILWTLVIFSFLWFCAPVYAENSVDSNNGRIFVEIGPSRIPGLGPEEPPPRMGPHPGIENDPWGPAGGWRGGEGRPGGWWYQGNTYPAFSWNPSVSTGYWQCTAFNSSMNAYWGIAMDPTTAEDYALGTCESASTSLYFNTYDYNPCVVPPGYCAYSP